MMTVNEVSKLTGVSIRTLQYYDKIGLLKPTKYTKTGYRLYDDTALETLQQILLFRELEFPLKDIKKIIDSPSFDKNKALEQQNLHIELLRFIVVIIEFDSVKKSLFILTTHISTVKITQNKERISL